jgi:hypothetical protein
VRENGQSLKGCENECNSRLFDLSQHPYPMSVDSSAFWGR